MPMTDCTTMAHARNVVARQRQFAFNGWTSEEVATFIGWAGAYREMSVSADTKIELSCLMAAWREATAGD